MDLNTIFTNVEVLKALATVLAALAFMGVIALVSVTGIKLTVKQAQQVRFYWTQYYPTIRAQVDEPTDRLPVAVDRALDRLLYADWDKLVSAFALTLVDMINKRVDPQEAAPMAEEAPKL